MSTIPGVLTPSARAGSLAALEVSPEVLRAIPADFAKTAPYCSAGDQRGSLVIATAAPGNQQVIDDLRLLTGLEVEEALAPLSEILEKIAAAYQVTVEADD